jgi:hypothetical protein
VCKESGFMQVWELRSSSLPGFIPIRSHRRATRCKPTFAPIRRLPTCWNS